MSRGWSMLVRLGLASVSTYLALLVAQTSLPFVSGVLVRVPFDTPFVRATPEIAAGMALGGIDASRTVLWFFYPGNDLYGLDLERRDPLLIRYLEEGFTQNLASRQEEIDRRVSHWLKTARTGLRTDTLAQLIDGESSSLARSLEFFSLQPLWRFARPPGRPHHDFALFRRVMEEARRTVERWGGRLVFVYLPDHVIAPRLPAWAREDAARTLETVRTLEIPVIDIEAATRSTSRSELFYYSTSHYSEEGNRIVAEVARQALAKF